MKPATEQQSQDIPDNHSPDDKEGTSLSPEDSPQEERTSETPQVTKTSQVCQVSNSILLVSFAGFDPGFDLQVWTFFVLGFLFIYFC